MHPEPLFKIFGQGVYLYGLCMALGIIACFVFLCFTMWKKKFNELSSDAVLFIGIFGTGFGIFSAMLFQATYNYIADPSGGFDLGGSMTFIGGLIGGVVSFVGVWNLYMFVIRPRTKIKWLNGKMNAGLTDALPFIPIAITIAHGFGRFGCFWAGCCYGKPTDAWFGLPCADGWNSTLGMVMDDVNVVPVQLFEMLFLFALAAIMAILYFKFKFNYNFGLYAIAYGIWRFAIEYARVDDRGSFIGAVTPSQFWSIIMVLLGIGYFFVQKYFFSKLMLHPERGEREESAQPEITEEQAQ